MQKRSVRSAKGSSLTRAPKARPPERSNLRMARALAMATVLGLTVVMAGDGPARADTARPSSTPADPPLLDRGEAAACCMPADGYRARTQFVTEMFRSVEEL